LLTGGARATHVANQSNKSAQTANAVIAGRQASDFCANIKIFKLNANRQASLPLLVEKTPLRRPEKQAHPV
tara:strand:- start:32 stop:244 length:213 start_codon:yes stop_codon:yes gene_type:complete